MMMMMMIIYLIYCSYILYVKVTNSKAHIKSLTHYPLSWNSLPLNVRAAPTVGAFRRRLKAHLFTQASPP
jgi:hypothetical protein